MNGEENEGVVSFKQHFKEFGIVKVSQALLALNISDGDCSDQNRKRLSHYLRGKSASVHLTNDEDRPKIVPRSTRSQSVTHNATRTQNEKKAGRCLKKPPPTAPRKEMTSTKLEESSLEGEEEVDNDYEAIELHFTDYCKTFEEIVAQSALTSAQMKEHHESVKAKILSESSAHDTPSAVTEYLSNALDQKFAFFMRKCSLKRMQSKAECDGLITKITDNMKRDFKKGLDREYIDENDFAATEGKYRQSALSEYQRKCLELNMPKDISSQSETDLTKNLTIFFKKQENLNRQKKPPAFE